MSQIPRIALLTATAAVTVALVGPASAATAAPAAVRSSAV